MDINQELWQYGTSVQIAGQLYDFVDILAEWNAKINLVSKNSFADVWERHIFDSLQLIDYVPSGVKNIVDIGSGAGFPAVVLAIAAQEKLPQAKITMVESITKKTVYLNDTINKLGLKNAEVLNSRVENTVFKAVDVVTARAVAALEVLFEYQNKIGNGKTMGIYLKGQSYVQEVEKACKKWNFNCEVKKNKYNESGVILLVSDLRRKI